MADEEVDFEAAKPVKLVADVTPEKTVAFFGGALEDSPLDLKDVDEKWMLDFSELLTEFDAMSKLVEMKKLELKKLAKGAEMLQRGRAVALFKTVKGRVTVDWQGYVKGQIKSIPPAELEPFTKRGEESVRFEGIKVLDSK
jgi:hypothetical protein